jgi:diguanylate cyclase (GGDEF)-like protein/PAS domain S-box-containing protein
MAAWVPAAAPQDRSDSATARRRWLLLCVAAVAATALYALLVGSGAGGPTATKHVANVGNTVMPLAAAAACISRAVQVARRTRAAWGFIGAGMLSWGLGQVCWTWFESIRGIPVPFPSSPDVGYLCMAPLVAVGLLLFPGAPQSPAQRARSVLDGLLIAVSMLLVSWILVIDPLLRAGEGGAGLTGIVILTYPINDVVIATVALYTLASLRRTGASLGSLVLVASGLITLVGADSGYAYLTLVSTYSSGTVLDAGWFGGFALVVLGARRPDAAPAASDAPVGSRPLGVLLPYVAVLVALAVSAVWLARHHGDPFISGFRSVLILLIVVRQVLTLLENRGLTRHLESRVAERTAELSASEQRFRALVQQSSDVVTVVDARGMVLYQSESVQRVFGYSAAVLAGRNIYAVFRPDAAARLAAAIRAAGARPNDTVTVELSVRHGDGHVRQAEITITNLQHDPNIGGFVLNSRDVSKSKQLQDQLVHDAHHDALTGLANRARFHEQVSEALRGSRRTDDVTVLFLDLDGFKEVNDSLGHAAGDQLLVQVADRLRAAVRDGDLVARFGGDEFAVLVRSIVASVDAQAVARRIVDELREPFALQTRDIHVHASIGVASAADAGDADQLMRNADLAMYQAKTAGGDGWTGYHPRMLSGLVQRLELEADLRLALDRNELSLHYQPTVDLTDSAVVGFEALIRWQHPTRGLVPPSDFIGIAEATGLITGIGRWVLTEACRQAVAWGAGDPACPLTMAVNVSVRQFERADLPAVVAEVLAETGMPAGQLCLEVTESVLMTDTEDNLAQLIRLKALGVHLAIDDFGTGYSSLAYLRRFPVDILKIDRSFVERLGADDDDAALVRTIVQLGQSLGMVTVAEGVEADEQRTALQRIGCDLAQGYYFARPLPAPQAGNLIEAVTVPAAA